jgi:hypothetical protein
VPRQEEVVNEDEIINDLDVLLVGEKHYWEWDPVIEKNVCLKCGVQGRFQAERKDWLRERGACEGYPKEGR